jgi:NADPH-dependent 2,4-dienoyl-CoA reductase/sulfur reductase-like enzyme
MGYSLIFQGITGIVAFWVCEQVLQVARMAGTTKPLKVLIAGAGIAGLATAVALARVSSIANLDIQLYEQAPELLEIGASIALSPNVSIATLPTAIPY